MIDTSSNARTHTFDNGLVLITEHMSGVQSLAMRCLVPAGAAHEDIHNLGASSVCAEMLMRGAGDMDSKAQADAFDRAGALRDVDNAIQFIQMSTTTLGHRIGDALPLFMDMVRRPRMSADSFAPAQELAMLGVASLADDPQQRTALAARERHLPAPYNRSTFGTQEGIASLTHESLCAWWDRLKCPNGTLISAAGDVDHDALVEQLGAHIADWNGETKEPSEEGTPARGYAHLEDDSNQVQIMIVHDAPKLGSDDNPFERLAISVLSGGMSGRLFTEVREKRGLCYTVSSAYRSDKDRGLVTNYVGTTPERAQESLDVLHSELQRINSGDVTQEELDRAKTGLKSRLVFAGESSRARASAIAADYHNLGRVRTLAEIVGQLDAISLDALNTYLKRRDLGKLTIQTLGPDALNPPA